MALWETMRGIIGEILLFIFVAATVAAAASVLDMLDSPTPQEGVVLGTFFTLIAGILYAARTYWDEKKYKRFVVTTTLAPTLVVLSIANVAHTVNIELVPAFFGTAVVFIIAAAVAGIVYLFRWGYVIHQWCIKMRIKKARQGRRPQQGDPRGREGQMLAVPATGLHRRPGQFQLLQKRGPTTGSVVRRRKQAKRRNPSQAGSERVDSRPSKLSP